MLSSKFELHISFFLAYSRQNVLFEDVQMNARGHYVILSATLLQQLHFSHVMQCREDSTVLYML